MSTHSDIILHVKAKDIGKRVTFDINQFPKEIELEYSKALVNGHTLDGEAVVIGTEEYLSGYCHFDGHIESVGKVLYTYFNSYEKVLNLLCLAPYSYLEEKKALSYHLWYKAKEDRYSQALKPEVVKVYRSNDSDHLSREQYSYKFEEDKWWVKSKYAGIFDWVELTPELIEQEENK